MIKKSKSFPKIMGILNVTPNSFSDGGNYFRKEDAINHAFDMIADGADIIDIGGESSRPGAIHVGEEEELFRVLPVVTAIKSSYPGITVSIDTTKKNVALEAIKAGADIINDISGLDIDSSLADIAASFNKSMILMHMQGNPQTMQSNPYYEDVVIDVFESLSFKINKARTAGVKDIIADVGIGFGKTVEHNLSLLKNHQKFLELGVQMCLGISRKSFIGKILKIEKADERDTATAIFHSLLINSGADILRVHNVKMISDLKKIYYSLFD